MSMTIRLEPKGWTGWVTVCGADTDLNLYRQTPEKAFELTQRLYRNLLEQAEAYEPCSTCDGSGFGLYETQTCGVCHGTGLARGTNTESD